jgi:hypothetical protein
VSPECRAHINAIQSTRADKKEKEAVSGRVIVIKSKGKKKEKRGKKEKAVSSFHGVFLRNLCGT